MCTISRVRAGKERGQRLEKRDHSLGMPHGDDCALWLGSLSRFVQPSRTARYSGLAGQSPLPEKALLDRDRVVANGREIRS